MIELFLKGGVLMWPILLCSILSLAIIIERLIRVQPKKVIPEDFLTEVQNLVQRRKISEATILCKTNSSSMAQVLLSAIQSFGQSREVIREKIEESGKKEAILLERGCTLLGTVASVAPLLGLLGTVFGMIQVFHVLSVEGIGNANSLAAGIAQALLTTAAGLVVAIPSLVAYKYFVNRAQNLVIAMEEYSVKLLDHLGERS